MGFGTHTHWQVRDNVGRRKYLSAEEREHFLTEAGTLAPKKRVLCYVLAYTGCRISEVLALERQALDLNEMTLTFRTLKRRRTVFRSVPIPRELGELLGGLPPAANGRFWEIHRATAWRWVSMAMKAAGIEGSMASPKGLRHGFGIRAASRRVPANLIQRWLGHASPATTAIYVDAVGIEERQFAERMW